MVHGAPDGKFGETNIKLEASTVDADAGWDLERMPTADELENIGLCSQHREA